MVFRKRYMKIEKQDFKIRRFKDFERFIFICLTFFKYLDLSKNHYI